jgi:hypothetical protein
MTVTSAFKFGVVVPALQQADKYFTDALIKLALRCSKLYFENYFFKLYTTST